MQLIDCYKSSPTENYFNYSNCAFIIYIMNLLMALFVLVIKYF